MPQQFRMLGYEILGGLQERPGSASRTSPQVFDEASNCFLLLGGKRRDGFQKVLRYAQSLYRQDSAPFNSNRTRSAAPAGPPPDA